MNLSLHRVRQMLDGCGTGNRNDLLVIAISALIEAGVNTRGAIVGAAISLGFKCGHAGAILSNSIGGNPSRAKWQRGAEGVYAVLA